jgi:chemotaxis signal transduction protein
MDAARSAQPRKRRFLIVRAGDLMCALQLLLVRRILRSLKTHPVPGSQPELLGLGQWRGEPLAVLDLNLLVAGGEPRTGNSWVTVIVKVPTGEGEEMLGMAVDEEIDVVRIAEDEVEAVAQGLVVGEATHGTRLVRILDLTAMGTGP